MQCQEVEQGKIHAYLPFRRQGEHRGICSRETPRTRHQDVSRRDRSVHEQLEDDAKAHKSISINRLLHRLDTKITQQSDGSYRYSNVGSGKTPLPLIDTVKDTGYVVRAALQSPPGKTVLGAGSMLSWSDFIKVWCEVNKVPFGGYDETPLEVFEKHSPIPDLGQEIGEMFSFFDEFGYTGGEQGVVQATDVS